MFDLLPMPRPRGGLLVALSLGAAACGGAPPAGAWTPELSPSQVEASTQAEAAVLQRAPTLPTDTPVDVNGQQVTANAIYSAASGRQCRRLHLAGEPRLACESLDAAAPSWVFVPVLTEGP